MSFTRIASTPVTHIGWGSIEQLITEVKRFDTDKILVVADPVLKQIGVIEQALKSLTDENYKFDLYTEIIPEPLLETGQKLVDFARKGDYSLVIGIGGGSALDLAKIASVFLKNDGSVKEYLNLSGSKTLQKKGVPKIFIPTTSGTGTEVTNISVLALENTKDIISHDYLIADVAIVDPQLTISMSPKVTAATGADALTHAIEAYISKNANEYSDGLALQAVSLISQSLVHAVKDGKNKKARINMSYGSYLAGLAFFNAGVGAIHALAYPLGGQFHLSHGESNAVLIPYVMNYIRHTCFERISLIYKAMGEDIAVKNPEDSSEKCIYKLSELLITIGIPRTLEEFGITLSSLPQLTSDGFKQKRLLSRCPMELNENDIFNIYRSAFSGTLEN
jgi:alcohol dehydrogenase